VRCVPQAHRTAAHRLGVGSLHCAGLVHDSGFSTARACLITPSIECSGRWYCKIHDPDRVRAKRAARTAQYQARQTLNHQNERDMRRLADRLGCGCPYYHTDSTFTKSGYWRALILTETEILKLLARLSPDG